MDWWPYVQLKVTPVGCIVELDLQEPCGCFLLKTCIQPLVGSPAFVDSRAMAFDILPIHFDSLEDCEFLQAVMQHVSNHNWFYYVQDLKLTY